MQCCRVAPQDGYDKISTEAWAWAELYSTRKEKSQFWLSKTGLRDIFLLHQKKKKKERIEVVQQA